VAGAEEDPEAEGGNGEKGDTTAHPAAADSCPGVWLEKPPQPPQLTRSPCEPQLEEEEDPMAL